MTVRLRTGDCRTVMRGMEAGSVQCVVTSPPFYGLRELGYFVEDISDGVHWADILVWGYDHNLGRRVWRAFEIKTATGRLTEGERAMMDEWPGSVQVVRSVVDVLAAFGRCQ